MEDKKKIYIPYNVLYALGLRSIYCLESSNIFSFVNKIKQLFLVSQETSKMQRERDNSCVMNDALKVGTWKRLCLCFLFLLEQTLKETWFYRILSTLGGFITYMHISWYTHGYTYWTLVIVQLL